MDAFFSIKKRPSERRDPNMAQVKLDEHAKYQREWRVKNKDKVRALNARRRAKYRQDMEELLGLR